MQLKGVFFSPFDSKSLFDTLKQPSTAINGKTEKIILMVLYILKRNRNILP
jgi:hypothetical protein